MEDEMGNLTKIWATAALSGCYCYGVSKSTSKGLLRLLLILPVAAFFSAAPYALTTSTSIGTTWFFLTWLGVSKLLLFSFGSGPLSAQQLSLSQFVSALLFPIKIRSPDPDSNPPKAPGGSPLRRWGLFGVKVVGLVCVFKGYEHKERMPYLGMLGLYCCHIYLSLEVALFLGRALARGSAGLELAPQVNRPYLASSLQDFWGNRWNLMVSDILRQTVHNPIRSITSPFIGRKPSILVGVFASFLISGLMHEWVFFLLTRVTPTWEVTCFFILNGVCLDLEMVIKMAVSNKWKLHRAVSWMLTVGFVVLTAFWLFFPPLLRDLEMVMKMAVANKWKLHRAVSWMLTVGFVVLTAFWLFFPPLLRVQGLGNDGQAHGEHGNQLATQWKYENTSRDSKGQEHSRRAYAARPRDIYGELFQLSEASTPHLSKNQVQKHRRPSPLRLQR